MKKFILLFIALILWLISSLYYMLITEPEIEKKQTEKLQIIIDSLTTALHTKKADTIIKAIKVIDENGKAYYFPITQRK